MRREGFVLAVRLLVCVLAVGLLARWLCWLVGLLACLLCLHLVHLVHFVHFVHFASLAGATSSPGACLLGSLQASKQSKLQASNVEHLQSTHALLAVPPRLCTDGTDDPSASNLRCSHVRINSLTNAVGRPVVINHILYDALAGLRASRNTEEDGRPCGFELRASAGEVHRSAAHPAAPPSAQALPGRGVPLFASSEQTPNACYSGKGEQQRTPGFFLACARHPHLLVRLFHVSGHRPLTLSCQAWEEKAKGKFVGAEMLLLFYYYYKSGRRR